MLQCKKDSCQQNATKQTQFIRETDRKLRDRIGEYLGFIKTEKLNQPG